MLTQTLNTKLSNMANNNLIEKVMANPDEKVFLIEGHFFTLNEFLHSNTGPANPPIDQDHLFCIMELNVGEVAKVGSPHYPEVKRVK
jgi:hypothetical protein